MATEARYKTVVITSKQGIKNSIRFPFHYSLIIPVPLQSKQPGGESAAGLFIHTILCANIIFWAGFCADCANIL